MTVPLTEREKQILDEIEQNLYSEDPALARQIREPWWKKLRQVKVGAGLVVAGIGCLIAGFVVNDLLLVLGFVAFVMMLLGIVLLSSATHDIARDRIALRSRPPGPSGSVSDKLTAWQEKLRQTFKKQP
ncbi:MAG TPA: DUF3040 domain-containing protein [Actinomycetota bacterium]|nr:DUF3040 domain-containing protein [Actinomycetota bacterium]